MRQIACWMKNQQTIASQILLQQIFSHIFIAASENDKSTPS